MSSRFSYLLAFVLPVSTCLFLTGGPYSWQMALAWTLPFWFILLVDWLGPELQTPSDNRTSTLYYDGILYALTFLQLINISLMLGWVTRLTWHNLDVQMNSVVNLVALRFMVGTSSGTSGIVVAHELIHRNSRLQRLLGHLLLYSVCYDHFVIAHRRGHHHHLGMPEDIATARFGESFRAYWHRTYLGYFRYAWQSELDRLNINGQPWQLRLIRHQGLQGLLIEVTLLSTIIWVYGWLAALMFLYQAFVAVRILEAVNYFQHWGLGDGRFGNTFGWFTTSWLSRHALIGLSNHIGHHQNQCSHYHRIAYSERGPKMPYGYFVMNLWVKLHNPSYQKMAENELVNFRQKMESSPVSLNQLSIQ